MFWDNVAGVYDVFVNIINGKTHRALRRIVEGLIEPGDDVLECACGTGLLSMVIAGKCRDGKQEGKGTFHLRQKDGRKISEKIPEVFPRSGYP